MRIAGAIGFELRRALSSARWVVFGLVTVLAAWLAQSSVRGAAHNASAPANAEDVVLALVNNITLVGYLLLPAFVLVVSGTLAADRSSGFALLTLARMSHRSRLWLAKVVVIVACALLVQAFVMTASMGLALGSGYPSSNRPSALALVPESEASTVLFAPARAGDSMRTRIIASGGLLALVFSAFGVMALTVSIAWNQEFVPPALVLAVVFFDWLIARFAHWPLYRLMSPTAHLLESAHIPTLPDAVSWGASIGYFAVLLAAASLGGWWLFDRADV